MADVRELKDQAAKLFSKGRFDKAAAAYEQLVKLEPRDTQMKVRLGDAWLKAGEKGRAVASYKVAAETYAREGFLPRAIAVCKLILDVEPSHVETQNVLAQLYAKRSGRPVESSAPARPAPAAPAARPAAAAPVAPAAPPKKLSDLDDGGLELDTSPRAAGAFTSNTPAMPVSGAMLEPASDEGSALELDTSGDYQSRQQAALERGVEVAAPARQEKVLADAPEAVLVSDAPAATELDPSRLPDLSELQAELPPELQAPQGAAPAAANDAVSTSLEIELDPVELGADEPIDFQMDEPADPSVAAPQVTLDDVPLEQPALLGMSAAPAPTAAPEATPAPPAATPTGSIASAFSELELEDPEMEAGWFAPPEDSAAAPAPAAATDEALPVLSLAELEIATVDEEEEIEVLTVSAELPVDAASLPEIPLFSDLSPEAFVELASQCDLRRPMPGEVVVQEGSIGTSFFVLCSGTVKVCRQGPEGEIVLARLTEGAFFGEMALLSGAPRAASVVAEDDTECLEISATLLAGLQKRYPHVGQVLKKFCRQRLLSNVMATSPLFRPFEKSERKSLVEKFKARDVGEGERILEEGRIGDGLYVVMAGEVEVRKQKDGGELTLARLKEGELFGEISLLTKSAATATVAAAKRSTVLRMPRATFDELISTHPQILMLVSELSDERLRIQQALEAGAVAFEGDDLMLV